MPHEFYCMTWSDYSRFAQGYWLRQARAIEGHRITAYTILMVNRAKGKTLPPMQRIWPLITDPKEEAKPLPTKEEMKAIAKRYLQSWHPKKD